ncbi:PH domain-containing protein [Cryobacterium sp. M96]|uniref:PH domain-containing protein n=1 Tax=Cryobacterium sp. M96 TaxID=2048295 RepID=UPI000CE401CD|nr:PH domain-containing protein [Cryobacterium sp. M96]
MTTLADGEWHRLHPASPLLRGGIFIVAVLGFIIANLRERLIDVFFGVPRYGGDPIDAILERGVVGWALLAVAVVLVLILAVFYLSWRMHTFRVTGEVVEVRSGMLFRSNRRARLDRIQGVNIVRPFIPRLIGAAKLEVSVAGQDANVQLAYLGSTLADQLRRDILRLASGLRQQAVPAPDAALAQTSRLSHAPASPLSPATAAADRARDLFAPELDPDAAPPESVVRIPPGRLIGSVVFSGFTVFVVLAGIALIVGVTAGGSDWLLVAFIPTLIASVSFYFTRVIKSLRYSIAGTPDGVRVGFGLLTTSNETLPPGRVHAIGVSQPLLWRPFGWWQVRINTAGHSSTQGAAGEANTTTLPVGTLADVARVLELILPGFDSAEQQALIERGLRSKGGDDGFTNAPRRAAWLHPFSWRRTGYTVVGGIALLRRGVISRELVLVPLARLQSVAISQGPVTRMLRLASARLHTVAGPVSAYLGVVAAAEALVFFDRIASGAISSAQSDTSHHWNQPIQDQPTAAQPTWKQPNGVIE